MPWHPWESAMSDIERVREKVLEYCSKYRNPVLPVFDISGVYDLHKEWRTTQFPYSDDQGCYVFYSENLQLLYVGKASLNHALGARIAGYFRWDLASGKLTADGEWKLGRPCFLQTIKVCEAFEAPSLEEFLLRKLKPENNSLK
jgi:hypothetical protein